MASFILSMYTTHIKLDENLLHLIERLIMEVEQNFSNDSIAHCENMIFLKFSLQTTVIILRMHWKVE